MHLDDDDYEVSKAWRLFWSWEMFWSVAPYFISWIWLILSYPLILYTGCLWFKPKKRAISHHCWSIGRRGWTCTGSSWPCPRSGCWGWRAGWRWAPATRWSLPGSPPSSLEVAFSNLKPPAFESVKVWDHCWLYLFTFTNIQVWEFKGHFLSLWAIFIFSSLNFSFNFAELLLLKIRCRTIRALIVALLTIDCVLKSRFAIIDCSINIAF